VNVIEVMICDRVAWDEIAYISSSFWMSPALSPSLWPIRAFGSCNINRHLHFSYRPTQYS